MQGCSPFRYCCGTKQFIKQKKTYHTNCRSPQSSNHQHLLVPNNPPPRLICPQNITAVHTIVPVEAVLASQHSLKPQNNAAPRRTSKVCQLTQPAPHLPLGPVSPIPAPETPLPGQQQTLLQPDAPWALALRKGHCTEGRHGSDSVRARRVRGGVRAVNQLEKNTHIIALTHDCNNTAVDKMVWRKRRGNGKGLRPCLLTRFGAIGRVDQVDGGSVSVVGKSAAAYAGDL